MSGIALAGLLISGAGAAFSFVQAGNARKRMREASTLAQASLDKAKARTEMNKYDKLAINKEVYRQQRDSLTAAAAQVTQAAAEGDQRGVGATAGKIQAATTGAPPQVTAAQPKEVMDIEKIKAAEDARLADERMKIDIGEANQMFETANVEAQNAAASTSQGVQGLVGVAQQGLGLAASGVGNNSMNRSLRQLERATEGSNTDLRSAILGTSQAGGIGYERFKDIGVNNPGYQEFIDKLNSGPVTDSYLKKQISQFYSPSDIDYLKGLYGP